MYLRVQGTIVEMLFAVVYIQHEETHQRRYERFVT